MTRTDLDQRLTAAREQHRAAYFAAVDAVNEYLAEHPEGLSKAQQETNARGTVDDTTIAAFVDDMLMHGAWIQDRLAGRVASTSHPTYRGSLSQKVRRLLGYTL